MYKKMDDWISVAQKTEMDTIDEMCAIIKEAIENETKIQHELRICFMDFTVDNSTFNFINPPLPKLDALEEFRTDRFAIPQLESLLQEFLLISKSTGDEMQTRELSSLLFSKIKNSDTFRGHFSALPDSWNKLGLQNINNIIRNLDPTNTGFVNWRVLMTCLILLRSAVPTAAEISKIESGLEQNKVSESEFLGQNYWFE